MIENPVFEFIVILFLGFCLGVIATQWYILRISRNIALKMISVIGVKVKDREISFEQLWKVINKVITKSVEEIKDEETKKKFKDEISTK